MLLASAVGDAYGMAWEFTRDQRAPNDLSAFHANPAHPEVVAGRWTDDTMRSLANASVVLDGDGSWFEPACYARAVQREHRRDGRQGWSRGFQSYLEEHREDRAVDFMRGLRRRATNGAVMGAAPLGFLPDPGAVRLACAAQCVSTHHGATIPHAQAVALAAHHRIRDLGPRSSVVDFLAAEVDWVSDEERDRVLRGTVPLPAMPSWTIAASAIHVLVDPDFHGLADRLRWIADRGTGGRIADVDSLGAVAMAICSCDAGIPFDLPATLVDHVEDEAGRARLEHVDAALWELAGRDAPGPVAA